MLEALIYISAANPTVVQRDIDDILEVAQRNNLIEELTGALIFSGTTFFQLLEGPAGNLNGMMRRIKADTRHGAVAIIAQEPIEQRRFKGWSMAYRKVESLAADTLHTQIGWDNSIKKLLDTIPKDRSIAELTSVIANLIEELEV